MIDNKSSSTAYVVIYKFITIFFLLEQAEGSKITPMALAHHLHPLEGGRGIRTDDVFDDVFPYDELFSSPYTQFII